MFVYELSGCGFESRCSHLNYIQAFDSVFYQAHSEIKQPLINLSQAFLQLFFGQIVFSFYGMYSKQNCYLYQNWIFLEVVFFVGVLFCQYIMYAIQNPDLKIGNLKLKIWKTAATCKTTRIYHFWSKYV